MINYQFKPDYVKLTKLWFIWFMLYGVPNCNQKKKIKKIIIIITKDNDIKRVETYRQLSVETFYYFRTSKLFGYINIPWMMYLWSIQKPPTESKKILGICFTIATLWSYLFQFTTWTLQLSVLNFLSIFISRKVYILAWLNLSLGNGSNFSSLYENRANIPLYTSSN